MKFFKYLVFLFLSLFSAFSYSQEVCTYTLTLWGTNKTFNSVSALCTEAKAMGGWDNLQCIVSGNRISGSISAGNSIGDIGHKTCVEQPQECWFPDYKIVSQDINNKKIKKTICLNIKGAMCKYTGDTKNVEAINGYITTIFSSVSKTPDPDCQEELANPPCDPKDPYGGCFQPADDGCTRQFDGSILCPDEVEPPIEQGCNGADYCKRPPQGCGQGYVSGTFNGERICIKTKPSTGGSDGGGSDGGGSDGGGSDGGGSDGGGSDGGGSNGGGSNGGGSNGGGSDGGGSPDLPVTPDLSGVINAIKNVASKIDHYSKEIIESIDTMSKKFKCKLDTSNGHLDQIEANTLATKNNTAQTNDLLQQILDKTGTGGDGSGDPSTGDNVDLTETNGLLAEIRDGINEIKNVFSDDGKEELEQIGQPSNDSRFTAAEANAQSSLNNLANKLTFGSSACLSDFQIQLPIFGSVNIALSQWCSLLALIKILFQLVVLLTCLRMLDATVRTI